MLNKQANDDNYLEKHRAWHFRFAVCLVVKVLCGHFCIACLRPLTRR
nr:DUF3265 domain-containing protein [Vibrio navarrensis]